MTNGDRIRGMSDEDLAILFAKLRADLHRLNYPVQVYRGSEVNANYDWLIQSAGVEANHG